jgi:hypothetical protein
MNHISIVWWARHRPEAPRDGPSSPRCALGATAAQLLSALVVLQLGSRGELLSATVDGCELQITS